MQQQDETETKQTIPFQDEEGNPLYFRVNSSAGLIPIRIDGMTILEEDEDQSKVSIDYQIDAEHADCPDLSEISEAETIKIMSTLKEQIPKMVNELLEDSVKHHHGEE